MLPQSPCRGLKNWRIWIARDRIWKLRYTKCGRTYVFYKAGGGSHTGIGTTVIQPHKSHSLLSLLRHDADGLNQIGVLGENESDVKAVLPRIIDKMYSQIHVRSLFLRVVYFHEP